MKAPKTAEKQAQVLGSAARARIVKLAPLSDGEIEVVRETNRRNLRKKVMIGTDRAIDGERALPAARDLDWIAVEGARVAQVAVSSPQAAAMRLAVDLRGVPDDVDVTVFGSGDAGRVMATRVGDVADRSVPWWTPVTEGETQTVEFRVPAPQDPKALPLRVVRASHLFAAPSSAFRKTVDNIGQSPSCMVDVKCSALTSSQAFLDTRNAIVQMLFNKNGGAFLCTGNVLNDTDAASQIPWLYSANHCFENDDPPYKTPDAMQAVASTLNTFWFFEAVSCNDHTTIPPYVQRTGGATYIYNNADADVLFVRLNDTLPAGSFLAGWDPNTITAGTPMITIHHPRGDLKKVAAGNVTGFAFDTAGISPASFIEVFYTSSSTDLGSSGAGLFSSDGSNYYLRGGIFNGNAFCDNLNGTDHYSRFDAVYAALRPYLSPSLTPITNVTDLWWNPNESGWGLSLQQGAASTIVFGTWYTYDSDGKRMWVIMPTGSWSSSTIYTGPLYITSGPPYTQAWNAGNFHQGDPVGTATLTLTDANNGTWAYSINGLTGVKNITRFPF